MRNFLIDTDTASDDAVAIIMALSAQDVRVLGLTIVAGNVGLDQATRNALLTADVCGSDVPVFMGAQAPADPAAARRALVSWERRSRRPWLSRSRARARARARGRRDPAAGPRESGPHAGDARAADQCRAGARPDPALAGKVGRCVVMGGAPCCEGNVTPAAEYNIWVDPEAARAVFRSALPIEMIGWHVSRGASVLSDAEVAAIEALGTNKARFAIESQQPRPRGLSCPDRRGRPVARRPDGHGGRARPLGRPLLVAASGGDRMLERTHAGHDGRRPSRRQFGRNQPARSGRGRRRRERGADILWTFNSAKFKSMLKEALARL